MTKREDSRIRDRILRDLINAMLAENLFGLKEKGRIFHEPLPEWGDFREGEAGYRISLFPEKNLCFPVVLSSVRGQLELSRLPVVFEGEGGSRHPGPVEVFQLLLESEEPVPNGDGFIEELRTAQKHATLALEAWDRFREEPSRPESLRWTERLASMRDRPFHPTARAKVGWEEEEYRNYSPEFGNSFGIDWVAVQRNFVRIGGEGDRMDVLLGEQRVMEAMREKGLSRKEWVPVPVHPWQSRRMISSLFEREFQEGILVPLLKNTGCYQATSSLRTLAPWRRKGIHLKLALGIGSLSALRILPSRYLENGSKAQAAMEALLRKDPVPGTSVHLCDERDWCVFRRPGEDPFGDRPGHLAAQIRRYPESVTADPGIRPVPMSALAVEEGIDCLGLSDGRLEEMLERFRSVCEPFVEMALQFASHGVMPEVHGQNVLLLFRNGSPEGIVLRDHDTLRIHPPWMEAAGVKPPRYTVKPGTPNNLILSSPEALLAYFQTLGVQVNLGAIADAWSRKWGIGEEQFFRQIRASVEAVLEQQPIRHREVFRRVLLREDRWPFKKILAPLLQRKGTGGGSMPSGTGYISNPLSGSAERERMGG
ncbi:IucA/IucC family protein [Melghirimyces profundicolus]|uniref:IucA/IucC family protein n=1 Tax=Melghirimyces profundicolus TaxID=1242148 RepID=UPI0011B23338|nr:IucA/IucC family protein [Melghirimyces profundicolus]